MPGSFVLMGLYKEKKKRAENKERKGRCAEHCITASVLRKS